MKKILDYIEQKGEGRYHFYRTQKMSLDSSDADILNYEDKPISANKTSKIAETDLTHIKKVVIRHRLIENARPLFSCFLDGSRHVCKIDDIAIGKKIFPVLAGQIIVGCCERSDRDTFKPYSLKHKIVLSLPDEFDVDDEGVNFCRLYCEEINNQLSQHGFVGAAGIKIDDILLYKTDQRNNQPGQSAKDNYKNRGVAKIQAEMTDTEQLLVAELCGKNKLDAEHFLIKDGSLEYNPSFSNFADSKKVLARDNYRYVVGVSKSFDPELLPDFEGQRLSRTIA